VVWAIPDLAKWAIIFTSSFIVIMSIYEFLVRRNNILRFLFGMKVTFKVGAISRATVLAGDKTR
jgi:hypothetical protein